MGTYACVYFGAALLAQLLTPVVARIARARGIVDAPGTRKVHKVPVPRVGGVAIVLAMLALTIPVLALDNVVGQAFRQIQAKVLTLLVVATLMFVVGLLDDLRGLPAKLKLMALLGGSLAICMSGASIASIEVDNWFVLDLGWSSWPITIMWIIGVTVGMNFIDGLDGLAGGIAAIVCGVIALLAYHSGQLVMAVLMLSLMGSLTGFLFFNFNPAKIFMGDGGSMFLGFMIGAGSVVTASKTATVVGIALPALALGVPILDALFTILRRGVLERRSIFAAERGHIHHRLLDLGLRQRHVVIAIYALTLLSTGLGTFMLTTRREGTLAVFFGVLLMLLTVFHVVGAGRLGEILDALQRNRSIARQCRQERSSFEDAQLRMRESRTFEQWWQGLCSMGGEMGFAWLALSMRLPAGDEAVHVWRNPTLQLPAHARLVNLSIPLGGGGGHVVRLDLATLPHDSLECVGRRVGLFGRLIDEHAPDKLADWVPLPASAGNRPEPVLPLTKAVADGAARRSLLNSK